MEIGIFVHSHTGHTLEFCRRLEDRLIAAGHRVRLEQLAFADGGGPNDRTALPLSPPDPSGCDAVIFAAPVWAFSATPMMRAFLSQIPPLGGRPAACAATMSFPFAWMGGGRAVGQMKALCERAGAKRVGTAIVNWNPPARREAAIAAAVEKIAAMF